MSAPENSVAQWTEAGRWLAKPDEDVAVAELALGRLPPLTEPAAFHCQQAAEKMLKALLVTAGAAPARSHDMERLVESGAGLYPTLGIKMQASPA
jgi:HEPN domain-containing protein